MSVPRPASFVPRQLALEQSALGRVYIWADAPLLYTTADFDGYFTDRSIPVIGDFIKRRFSIDASLRTGRQVHGIEAVHVTRDAGRRTRDDWKECDTCDALWSDANGVALAIKVADCLPVTLIDSEHRIIANIHSGWRGAAQAITAHTLHKLKNSSAFSPRAARAYLGPSIRQCCFEVGEEVIEEFRLSKQNVDARVDRRRGARPFLDLVGITTDVLLAAGLRRDAIYDSGLCTRCDGSLFHSFRRDGRGSGRNLAIVAQ